MARRKPPSKAQKDANPPPPPAGNSEPVPEGTYWRRVRLTLLRLSAVLGALLVLLALMTGGAAEYTSRSQFCSSCHIMEPYYVSWQESSHHNVSCIKCHFPPGAVEKVRGKLMGLVQLLKYVTQSAGPRPAAAVSDASCLRCHDTRLLAGRVSFHGVPFDHRPHLTQKRRGKQLRCTSCHSQIVQGVHMTVTPSTCFLCHFKDNGLNEGLGTCTRCHAIPERSFDLGGGVKFNHELVYERGIDCANCHRDVIRGNGDVPLERCTVCHNRPADLERINDHVFIHEKHVTENGIDCLNCHLEIEHSLDKRRVEHAAANCQACHGNQHWEQVQLLQGEGGKSIPAEHGGMAVAGISCPSCHQVKEVSATGTVLWRASTAICTECHDEAAAKRLRAYHEKIRGSLADIEASLKRAREAVPAAKLQKEQAEEVTQQLGTLEHDLQFLRVGNSIHNMHYADVLVHALVEKLSKICKQLNIAEPAINLPQELK
jgi:predicted CXXCH cytochrome family protein